MTIERIERTTIAAVDCVNSLSHVVLNCLSFVEPILLLIILALAGVGIFLFGLVSILACLKPKLKRLPIEALTFPVSQSSNSLKQSFNRSLHNRVFKQKNCLDKTLTANRTDDYFTTYIGLLRQWNLFCLIHWFLRVIDVC